MHNLLTKSLRPGQKTAALDEDVVQVQKPLPAMGQNNLTALALRSRRHHLY